MRTTRIASKKDIKALKLLLNKNLRFSSASDVTFDYPLVFNEKNFNNVFIIEEASKIIATGSLYPVFFNIDSKIKIKISMFSSIVSDADYRGQGLGSSIIKRLLTQAEKIESDIAILWSDLHSYYSKFGFVPCGVETALKLNINTNDFYEPSISIIEYYNTHNSSWKDFLTIYNNDYTNKVARQAEDFIKLLNLPNTFYMIAYNQEKKPLAYLVIEKGEDFPLHIHEWSGDIQGLQSLIYYAINKFTPKVLTIIAESSSNELFKKLLSLGAVSTEQYMGLIKIINKNQFYNKLKLANIFVDNNNFTERNIFGQPNSNTQKPKLNFYLKGLDSV